MRLIDHLLSIIIYYYNTVIYSKYRAFRAFDTKNTHFLLWGVKRSFSGVSTGTIHLWMTSAGSGPKYPPIRPTPTPGGRAS